MFCIFALLIRKIIKREQRREWDISKVAPGKGIKTKGMRKSSEMS